MTIAIRPARGPDVPAIDSLLRASVATDDEAGLVRDLCVAGEMVLMMVAADDGGAIVGTVAFSRMEVRVAGQPVPAVALAPLAVASAHRREGVAEALVQAGLDRLEEEGVVLCFVLGTAGFYARFGFDADYARGFESPYAGDQLLAMPLQGGLMPCGVRGIAAHAPPFAQIGSGE